MLSFRCGFRQDDDRVVCAKESMDRAAIKILDKILIFRAFIVANDSGSNGNLTMEKALKNNKKKLKDEKNIKISKPITKNHLYGGINSFSVVNQSIQK